MASPHDLMVLWKHDPEEAVMCPICKESFVAELGVSQECAVMLAGETEYHARWLIFCGHLCAFIARRGT